MGRPGCSGKREIPECRRQVRLGTGRSCVSSSPRAFSAFRYVRHECEVSSHYASEPAIRRRPPTEIRSGQAERVSRLSVGPPVFRTPTNSTASAIRPARHRFPGSGIRPGGGTFPFSPSSVVFVVRYRKSPKGVDNRSPDTSARRRPFLPDPAGFPANRTERSPQPTMKHDSFRTAYVRRRHESPVGIIFSGTAPFFFRHETSGSFLSRRTGAGNPNGHCAGPGAEEENRTNRSGSSVRKGVSRHGSRTKTRLCFHFGRKIVTFAGKRGLSGKMREKKRAASPREPADGSDSNTQTT